MSYLNNNPLPDEKILYRAKPHWVIFWPSLCFLLLSLLLFGYGLKHPAGITLSLNKLMARLALLAAVVMALPELVTFLTSEYGLTNKRVLMKTGFFHRISLDIRLSRVETVIVQQTLPGQLLNYGSVLISGVGGSKDPFPSIAAPLIFRQKIQEQLEN
jgi:uncharacterized membrane protein YdbT with pleckstrin-like domain